MQPEPDLNFGLDYWRSQSPTLDTVLGGFSTGSLPRIDALGSRQFLQSLLPELCTVPSAIKPLKPPTPTRFRALDVGAGVGRVTSDVLLHLVHDVLLLEPVDGLVREAINQGRQSADASSKSQTRWRGILDKTKSVTFCRGTLQDIDPAKVNTGKIQVLDRVGYVPSEDDLNSGFDVVWAQWCLGHLSDPDLVAFLKRCKGSLRTPRSLIVVKENLCSQPADEARTVFDEQDSSLTRSDQAWKDAFNAGGLELIAERVQDGLPEGLYQVKAFALR